MTSYETEFYCEHLLQRQFRRSNMHRYLAFTRTV